MSEFGLTINGKHTSEFGLKMLSMYIPLPEPKESYVSVPGASGGLDLSEVTGQLNYQNREDLQFEFLVYEKKMDRWANICTDIAMWLHGRKVNVIPDNEMGYYYVCRLRVDRIKSDRISGRITVTGSAEPFKYDRYASDEMWQWDSFNFNHGVIRNLSDLTISENANEITIAGGGKAAVPEFIVTESANLAVIAGGRTHNMYLPGTYRFPDIRVADEAVTLEFTGTGNLSIRYRGRYL